MTHLIKRFAGCCIGLLLACFAGAQPNISNVEYYIDADPGFGRATAISFTAGNNLSNIALNINPTSLTEGVHVIGIRAKDASGVWSHDNKWLFIKAFNETSTVANLSRVEYYIDKDPGFGKATAISFTASSNLNDIALNINPSNLSEGVHVVGIRAKDANGVWSHDNKWLFVKAFNETLTAANLSRVEYYVDNDPGFGKATAVSFTAGTNLSDIALNINPSSLSEGVHVLAIRARDEAGNWSHDNKWLFLKAFNETDIVSNISQVEYYIDNDPGFGSGSPVSFAAGNNLSEMAVNINPFDFNEGVHVLGIRAKDTNGGWSHDNKWLFLIPAAKDTGFAPNLTSVEYYIDTDPGFGKGTPIAINNITNLPNFNLSVNISGLAKGTHKLFIRSKDANGKWSYDYRYSFSISTAISAPSIVVNSITPKVLCAWDTVNISFDAKGTYNTGNKFVAQLSDSSGSFASPVVIGIFSGNGSSIINAVLPAHSAEGSKYRVRVNSTNPIVTGITSKDSIVIHDAPYAQTITGASDVNVNTSTAYTVPAISGSSWQWSMPTATITPTANSASMLFSTVGTGQFIKVLETNQYGCKGDTSSKLVNVYALKLDSVKVSTLKPCPSSTITVTAKASGVYNTGNVFTAQLSNATGSFASPVSIGSVSASPVGNFQSITISAKMPYPLTNGTGYRIRIISSTPGVTSADNGQNITVSKPSLGADKSVSKCAGSPVNLTKLFTTTGLTTSWNVTRPDNVVKPGTYQLIATNSNGCKDTALVKVADYPKPNIGRDTTVKICEGTSTNISNLYNTTGLTAQWSTPTPQSVGLGTYSLVVTNSNGCKDTAVVIVAAHAKPNLGADQITYVCQGYTADVTGLYNTSGYTTVQWSTPTPNAVLAGSYTLIVANEFGCRDTAVVTVNVNPNPNLGADTSVSICSSSTSIRNLYNTTGYTSVAWSTPDPDNVGTGTYSLIVTNSYGCKDTASITVTASPKPNLGNDTTVYTCAGTTTNISGLYNTSGYATIQWSTARPDSAAVGTYTLVVSNDLGCTDTAIVTVAEKAPLNPTINPLGAVAFCKGDSVKLSVTGTFVAYNWSNDATSPSIIVKAAGSYSVTVKDASGCTGTSDAVTVTENPLPPVPTISASPTTVTNVCPGTVVTLTSSSATAYRWSTGATTRSIKARTAGGYIVKAYNANGCSIKSATKSVTYRTCGTPVTPVTKTSNDSSATVSWRRVTCATGYEIQYRKAGTSAFDIVPVTDTFYTIPDLFPGTKYEWQVRTTCSNSPVVVSSFTSVATFTTTGSPIVFRGVKSGNTLSSTNAWDASVYPNPTTKDSRLMIKGNLKEYTVSITTIEGKLLWKSLRVNTTSVALPIQNWTSGVYLVTVENGAERRTLRLVIQR